jgi:putative thioredoxin
LAQNPADEEASVGLAQVRLMQRTAGVDQQAARAAAAEAPGDIAAQMLVADCDVLGGHVEDAFARLVETVRVTEGDERDTVREHLVELFAVVGAHDERVMKARRALMSALF